MLAVNLGDGISDCKTGDSHFVANPKLSIIIVSYNTCDVTCDCLGSIYAAQWRTPFEIIVVDNASHDGSVDKIRERFPQIKIIANEENLLFSRANNQGAEIARGEYLLLLNSDTLVKDDNLQRMVDYFDTLPRDVICIGPKVLNPDGSIQSYGWALPSVAERFCMCFKIHRFFPFIERLIRGLPVYPDRIREAGWVVGACMMMRAELYRKVGGLNENVEFYGEEPEFGYRTSKRYGLRTVYYPDASIVHLGGVSTKKSTVACADTQVEETRLRRYAKLQRETVGYAYAIWMSRVVIFAGYIKWLVSSDKKYFKDAISYEKRVVKYLQDKLKEETVDR